MSQLFEHGYAVIVGVGHDLPVTVNDATAIADQLCDLTRCAYPKEQVRLLTEENAQRANILSALEWLADTVSEQDTAVVYFSGHGIETPDFHLVPFNFNWGDLAGTAITGKEFTEYLRTIKAQKLLVLLDCCHAGGQAEAKGQIKSPLPIFAINELNKGSGRVVIASSRRDEVSLTGNPYSQFTMAVLEAMAGYGAFERDGFARVFDLAMWVGRVVPERTKDRQHPIVKISNLEDNFTIALYAGGDKAPKSLSWQPTVPTVDPVPKNSQVETWRRMLANYRNNLLLLEERVSEFVDFTSIPLQLEKHLRQTKDKITELEQKLGIHI